MTEMAKCLSRRNRRWEKEWHYNSPLDLVRGIEQRLNCLSVVTRAIITYPSCVNGVNGAVMIPWILKSCTF